MILKKVLLLGGSGLLGSKLIESNIFKNVIAPTSKEVNLQNKKSIEYFLSNQNINIVVNCAALARMKECEINPQEAINTNIKGTLNLVQSINYINNNILIIHISSDSVYGDQKKTFYENNDLNPYNVYAWTKLSSEYLIQTVKRHIIIRTRFFHEKKIIYSDAANDIVTSSIHVDKLPKIIEKIIKSKFNGIINVGDHPGSDFEKYSKFNKSLKKTTYSKIQSNLNYHIAKNAVMNLDLLKEILKEVD